MTAIGNPIRGVLHDNAWVRPPGNTDMRVTKTAAQHLTTGPAALDIGDGAPDLDDILCPHSGTVAQALTVGSANLSIDFDSGGKKWRVVLAHNTLPHPVAIGQVVTEGQVVGRMGKTSSPTMPVPIHLHIQLGWLNGSAFVWVDPWPYLRQNGATEEETDMLKGTLVKRIDNRKVTVLGNNTRLRAGPSTAEPILSEYNTGAEFFPDYLVDGGLALGTRRWYGVWGSTLKGIEFGYLHELVVSPLAPVEQTDCAPVVKAATDPLIAKITKAKLALA